MAVVSAKIVDGRLKVHVDLQKGDLPGHPFRGNQWEGGQGGSASPVDKIEAHLRLAQEARETRSPKRRQELRARADQLFQEVQQETGITDSQSPEWRALFDQARQQMGTPKPESKQEVKPEQKPEPKPLSPVKLDAKADAVVAEYQGLSYEINGYLREGSLKDAPSNIQQQVRKLDRVIADNGTTLEREEVLYRGLDMEDLPGNKFKDGGFGSSSTDQVSAAFFGDAVMKLRVQPRVRVLPILSGQESEVILERGLQYEIGERIGEVERRGRVVPVYDVRVSKGDKR